MSSILIDRRLVPHPSSDAGPFTISSQLARSAPDVLRATFVCIGPIPELIVPAPQQPGRADNLWETTCFEMFLAPTETIGYNEWNFSPSGQWAAYRFDAYRKGMETASADDVKVSCTRIGHDRLQLDAELRFPYFAQFVGADLGLSAILEHRDGRKTFWALAHPPGRPDFHHQACFAASLAPRIAP